MEAASGGYHEVGKVLIAKVRKGKRAYDVQYIPYSLGSRFVGTRVKSRVCRLHDCVSLFETWFDGDVLAHTRIVECM